METIHGSLSKKASELIPWGTQTNAKRHIPEMGDAMPRFIDHASGCRVVDSDGKSYIDYRSALGPIILGYSNEDVQRAVRTQLDKGVLFSMASPLEVEMAEVLTAIIPGLEQVRYLKSGNEVNHVAIRLARAYTGRDLIVTCGYHGHGDWFSCGLGESIGWAWPREGNGVPTVLDDLIVKVPYGDTEALNEVFETRGSEIAGMITVPYDWNEHVGYDFIKVARAVTQKHGSALIFDQILTGFRLGLDGAQGFFGVIPDLTTYGKAIANGFPLAVVGGSRDLMSMFENVMITTTHAGETLSLAAAIATIQVLQDEPVLESIQASGQRLQNGFDSLALKHGLSQAKSYGLPVAPQLQFADDAEENSALKSIFDRSLFENGIFPSTPYLINYAHKVADIDLTLEVMDRAIGRLASV